MNIEYNKNEDAMKLLVSELRHKLNKIKLGGGKKKIEKLHAKNKMTARERIAALIDKGSKTIEIGSLAGEDMYPEYGGCPSGGVVVVMGYVSGRLCVIVANDASVKAGAWFPITGKKNLRAQEIAMENHIPIIYLVDSAGIFLPMQDEIFADKEHFGRIFRNNAKMSAMGIPQIAAVMGSCVAGGAYLPVMSDESLIVNKTGTIFLAGSYLVKSAIGEEIDNETLGGATTQADISGVMDYKVENDEEALNTIRMLIDKIGHSKRACFDRKEPAQPKLKEKDIYGIMPMSREKPYDVKEIILRLLDNSEFTEYKQGYGKTIICGYGRIDGWSVGIVANQRSLVKTKTNEMQFGGVIYSDSANKATHFILNCNQKKIPLIFIHDVTGFMVGSRSEKGGIIKDGAKMVNAVANSIVPKFSIVIGNSYGAGNYAMCGKAYDPRLMLAWPTAKIAVMSGASAAKTLLQIKIGTLKAKGQEISKEEENKMLDEIKNRYEKQTSPYYAAARLWVDEIIDPLETRKYISMGIEAASYKPIDEEFKIGVIRS
ncbi:MAG TPA: acyl-CoA carboxylase subunit beta [Bacteroidales bacterium]|nr:acyl-CoA carboxylase subunit beta [Bacteroidales bacterium]